MNGAEALLRTLAGSRVEVCFANPGTTELHVVEALDRVPSVRGILCLFEGVATGAADGYGRMAGWPAAALLHLGPGLSNGLANLHNARRAHTPLVAIVGDHATGHRRYDAPLQSDIAALAGSTEGWVRRVEHAGDLPAAAAEGVAAAMGPPGRVATLIVQSDVSWSEVDGPAVGIPPTPARRVADDAVAEVAGALRRDEPAALLVGAGATRAAGLRAADAVRAACGARVICETFPARLERGGSLPPVERLGYLPEDVTAQLRGVAHLVLAGARSPVAFFGYPDQPGDLVPDGCTVHRLAGSGEDATAALAALADALGAGGSSPAPPARSGVPVGDSTLSAVGAALGELLPEAAIVSDEAVTASAILAAATERAVPHDWLSLTGGAIGQGLPVATGAAIACPDRPVVALQADGSALYTISALWTQAREGLDVTTVLLDNRSYAILGLELRRMHLAAGPQAAGLLDLTNPAVDFVALARGLGVPAERVRTGTEFRTSFSAAMAEPGPHLIDVQL